MARHTFTIETLATEIQNYELNELLAILSDGAGNSSPYASDGTGLILLEQLSAHDLRAISARVYKLSYHQN